MPDQDFSLYYGIASKTVNVNLLTYRESANEDGLLHAAGAAAASRRPPKRLSRAT